MFLPKVVPRIRPLKINRLAADSALPYYAIDKAGQLRLVYAFL